MKREPENETEILLQERPVPTILPGMSKTEQVRLPEDLMEDVRATAPALTGESAPAYIARVVREALVRDMPRAAKKLAERAEHQKKKGKNSGAEQEG